MKQVTIDSGGDFESFPFLTLNQWDNYFRKGFQEELENMSMHCTMTFKSPFAYDNNDFISIH